MTASRRPKWHGAALVACLALLTTSDATASDFAVITGSSDAVYCVGLFDVSSQTPFGFQTGDISIRSTDDLTGCDAYCGDGVVNGREACEPGLSSLCSSNCTWLNFPEYGGTSPYIDEWSRMQACLSTPPAVVDTVMGRDVTFLAFGDPQYGNNDPVASPPVAGPGVLKNRLDMNRRNIAALNRVEELRWPAGFVSGGHKVSRVRGVVIAGDLGQEGDACTADLGTGKSCGWFTNTAERDAWFVGWTDQRKFTEWATFRDEYGLCGDKSLMYPVFEGAGNHDYWRDVPEEFEHPIHKYIAYRNNFRKGVDSVDPLGRGHYSWTWDDVHFVQLNLAATDDTLVSGDGRIMKPYSALTFLRQDLARHAADGRPVVLISHYPWVGSTRFPAERRLALFQAIKPYNVVALVHGHNHGSAFRQWSPCEDAGATGSACAAALNVATPPAPYPVIDAGNPFYGNGRNKVYDPVKGFRRYGHFSVLRITDDYLEAATVSWRADVASVCDHTLQSPCLANPQCKWTANQRCAQNTEICLPGVTTLGCPPDDLECDTNLRNGGWAARVRLSDRAVVYQTERSLNTYCPGY